MMLVVYVNPSEIETVMNTNRQVYLFVFFCLCGIISMGKLHFWKNVTLFSYTKGNHVASLHFSIIPAFEFHLSSPTNVLGHWFTIMVTMQEMLTSTICYKIHQIVDVPVKPVLSLREKIFLKECVRMRCIPLI